MDSSSLYLITASSVLLLASAASGSNSSSSSYPGVFTCGSTAERPAVVDVGAEGAGIIQVRFAIECLVIAIRVRALKKYCL